MTVKPVYLGGRLIGFRDENGFPVGRGALPAGDAPQVRRASDGTVRVTGGNRERIETLINDVHVVQEIDHHEVPKRGRPVRVKDVLRG